ncbi:unnamed protein product, partial [Allacma fusca]
MAATNRNRITDLKTLQEAQQKTLDELEQKIKSNTENIRRLQNSFNEAITSMQGLQHDHDELKGKLISTNYVISYITSRLMLGRSIIKESHRNWKQGKITGSLLDYLNFTMPCGDNCPLHFAQAQSCRMSEDGTKLFMDFNAPIVSAKLTLVEADPF